MMYPTRLQGLFALAAASLWLAPSVIEASDKLLPFQAVLTDTRGVRIPDGPIVVRFQLFADASGQVPVWLGETHRTSANAGLINVILGTKAPFEEVDFSRTLYLELTPDASGDDRIGGDDPPMRPRQVIAPALFASASADSRKLAGHDWSALFGVNDPRGKLLPGKIADQSIVGAQIVPGSIGPAELANRGVTSGKLDDHSVLMSKLADEILDRLVPPGTVVAFAGPSERIPRGWLLCDGRTVSRAEFPELSRAIGSSWGAGDGTTTFNLPDLRGLFLRGVDGGTGRDPDRNSRTQGGSGGPAEVGSYQSDAFARHTHASPINHVNNNPDIETWPGSGTAGDPGNGFTMWGARHGSAPAQNNAYSGASEETRPKNAYVNYIIKF